MGKEARVLNGGIPFHIICNVDCNFKSRSTWFKLVTWTIKSLKKIIGCAVKVPIRFLENQVLRKFVTSTK